jgi:hypothetical protein
MFGCTGTAEQDGEDAAPFPQLVALTARAGRAMLGAIPGRTQAGEQTLLRRLARGRSPRAAPQEPRPSHRRRGILHRHMASHGPVHDVLPGHRIIIAGSDRRRNPRRRPRCPAHPQRPRTSAALQARAESTPEIPARHCDEGNRHGETAGYRVRLWVLITTAATRIRQEGGTNRSARRAADLADARSLPAAKAPLELASFLRL